MKEGMFQKCTFSVYNGENSMDLMDLSSVRGMYSWISCNHILEHVSDHRTALRELYSALDVNGILQIQVPSLGSFVETDDWGYPHKQKYGNFREYGLDFSWFLKECLPEAYFAGIFCKDPLTALRDIVFLISPQNAIF